MVRLSLVRQGFWNFCRTHYCIYCLSFHLPQIYVTLTSTDCYNRPVIHSAYSGHIQVNTNDFSSPIDQIKQPLNSSNENRSEGVV